VAFKRCELLAGSGKAGDKGKTSVDPVGPSDPNDPQRERGNGCV
jgi:hypothetical protein